MMNPVAGASKERAVYERTMYVAPLRDSAKVLIVSDRGAS